jgi:hypothetical protein
MVNVTANTNPWIETMKPYMTMILGSAETLALLSAAWVPSTATSYDNTIRTFVRSTDSRHSLLAHMARYVAWLGHIVI